MHLENESGPTSPSYITDPDSQSSPVQSLASVRLIPLRHRLRLHGLFEIFQQQVTLIIIGVTC